jgi:hypothetical protein
VKSGLDASAVGTSLCLSKNDGRLRIEFEEDNGAAAEWTLEGMELLDGEKMVAAVSTQTDVDPEKCLVCGEEKRRIVGMKDEETQTDTRAMQPMETQTIVLPTSSTTIQVALSPVPLYRQFPQAVEILGPYIDTPATVALIGDALSNMVPRMKDCRAILDHNEVARNSFFILRNALEQVGIARIPSRIRIPSPVWSTTTNPSAPTSAGVHTEPNGEAHVATSSPDNFKHVVKDCPTPALKQKASTTLDSREPLHKRAKSGHDSLTWPRNLYKTCFRSYPIFKGDTGTVHNDVKEAPV